MSESRITLPQPRTSGPVSLEAAIAQRRSVRRYSPEHLKLEEIGQLLWAAQGITGGKDTLRAAPSAGAYTRCCSTSAAPTAGGAIIRQATR